MFRRCKMAAILAAAVLVIGCAAAKEIVLEDYREAAKANYMAGMKEFEDEDFEDAKFYFNVVLTKYAVSQYAKLAKLRMADIAFLIDSWPEASLEYAHFIKSHPNHPCAPYAMYRQGLSSLFMVPEDWWFMPPAYERDLSQAEDAYDHLRRFLIVTKSLYQVPDEAKKSVDDYEALEDSKVGFCIGRDPELTRRMIKDAHIRLRWTADRLLARELYVARFYMKNKKPRGAVFRMQAVMQDRRFIERNLACSPVVLTTLIRGYIKDTHPEEACPAYTELMKRHPTDELTTDLVGDYPDLAAQCAPAGTSSDSTAEAATTEDFSAQPLCQDPPPPTTEVPQYEPPPEDEGGPPEGAPPSKRDRDQTEPPRDGGFGGF